MCMTGAMYPAMDLTAGEKERGTMETILSSPISRTHLVLGKFLLVLTASLVTAALSVTSMGISFSVFQLLQDISRRRDASLHIKIGLGAVVSVFLMVASRCRALLRRPDHHCPLRQNLQGSAELHLTADDSSSSSPPLPPCFPASN